MSEREQKALKTVKNYMWWSMGAGLIPVPWLDAAALAGVQLKMIADLSKIYEVPFQESTGKSVVASLGALLPHALSYGPVGEILKAIPVVGALAGTPAVVLFAGGYSWAVGNVFVQHFESGGTFLTFRPEAVKAHFEKLFAEGRRMAANMATGQKVEEPVSTTV